MIPDIAPTSNHRASTHLNLALEHVRVPAPGSDVDLRCIARLCAGRTDGGDLVPYLPGLSAEAIAPLAEKISQGTALTFRDRLCVALLRLSELAAPSGGEMALEQIARVFLAVEKVYAAQSIPLQEYREALLACGGRTTPDAMIEEAFRVYRFSDAGSPYEEHDYPRAFSRLLKPPALRYNKAEIFQGKDVIPQLSHLTVVDRASGAVQIQRIDAERAKAGLTAPGLPLICGIAGDREYFSSLPSRRDLVVYDRPGANGTDTWATSTWCEEAWKRSS